MLSILGKNFNEQHFQIFSFSIFCEKQEKYHQIVI